MTEEKKLTDEEIIKALECCGNRDNCFDCPIMGEMKRRNCICREIVLDLIHRLQTLNKWLLDRCKIKDGDIADQKAEIERLTNLYDGQSGFMTSSMGDLPLTVAGLRKAVDEISRLLAVQTELQELNAKYYNEAKDLRREKAELKKQVDELKERYLEESKARCEIEQLYKKNSHSHSIGISVQRTYWEKKVQQAVKDTAEKFADKLRCEYIDFDDTDEVWVGGLREDISKICKEITKK